MASLRNGLIALSILATAANAQCPYMAGEVNTRDAPEHLSEKRSPSQDTAEFLGQFELDDSSGYLTSDVGGPISDQNSLSAGNGPTLLEDFIFRQKIQHFDHERVPERAVHARGAGSHGVFESYGDWSNLTDASFLSSKGKQTPTFVRFSTVAGSRGSADTARDVHGFATRFYTDEGNFDIVGNNIPVFFIQDAIQFPDLIHAVKPDPSSEIPQAATAHDSAWDFFSQQPSTLHTLFWAMSGHGIPRSYRHMDGFGIHTFRMVNSEAGSTKLVKFHWKSKQGKASMVWEEAQATAGKNADMHRQDLFEAITNGFYPEWELGVQIMDEGDELAYGFDLLDPTKIVPEDIVPVTLLGKMTLNRNPRNYFAETEQVMFQPGHLVRGIDITDDPLLQGRMYSYLDTQLNRHGGPNFEQIPINRPRLNVRNNNRDGAGQNYIPLNTAAYSPNTLNKGFPKQANETEGRGFYTDPNRRVGGHLVRAVSDTFADVWSQPRLFYNSLLPAEQQFLINAIRFETSHLKSDVVKQNVLIQLNRVSHDIAVRVASALGMDAPEADPKFYHDNTTINLSVFNGSLSSLELLNVGVLTSNKGMSDLSSFKQALGKEGIQVFTVAEDLADGVDMTYSAADATAFDAVVVDSAAKGLLSPLKSSPSFPSGRPWQLLVDSYRYGKPVAAVTGAEAALKNAGITKGKGVYTGSLDGMVGKVKEGLTTFKFLDRFEMDP